MKSPHQDEYVAEADMVSRSMANSRLPIITVTCPRWFRGRRAKQSIIKVGLTAPSLAKKSPGAVGMRVVFTTLGLALHAVRCAKESEEDLSQRINCYASNAGTAPGSLSSG